MQRGWESCVVSVAEAHLMVSLSPLQRCRWFDEMQSAGIQAVRDMAYML